MVTDGLATLFFRGNHVEESDTQRLDLAGPLGLLRGFRFGHKRITIRCWGIHIVLTTVISFRIIIE